MADSEAVLGLSALKSASARLQAGLTTTSELGPLMPGVPNNIHFGVPSPQSPHSKVASPARLSAFLWEDGGTICYLVEARGITVARRDDNNYINGTKLLNVAGLSRGRRDGILKTQKDRIVIKTGPMHMKGVWIPLARAHQLADRENIAEVLFPLFITDLRSVVYAIRPDDTTSQQQTSISTTNVTTFSGYKPTPERQHPMSPSSVAPVSPNTSLAYPVPQMQMISQQPTPPMASGYPPWTTSLNIQSQNQPQQSQGRTNAQALAQSSVETQVQAQAQIQTQAQAQAQAQSQGSTHGPNTWVPSTAYASQYMPQYATYYNQHYSQQYGLQWPSYNGPATSALNQDTYAIQYQKLYQQQQLQQQQQQQQDLPYPAEGNGFLYPAIDNRPTSYNIVSPQSYNQSGYNQFGYSQDYAPMPQ